MKSFKEIFEDILEDRIEFRRTYSGKLLTVFDFFWVFYMCWIGEYIQMFITLIFSEILGYFIKQLI